MTEKELEEALAALTQEKYLEISKKVDELIEKEVKEGTPEFDELIDLYTLKEAYELVQFHLEYIHIKDMKRLMWSYTAIITAVFSVLFAIFMRK
jgi:hypothetical protein